MCHALPCAAWLHGLHWRGLCIEGKEGHLRADARKEKPMSTLDQEIDTSLRELERRRKAKMKLVIAAIVLAGGGFFALTSLMYSSTPGEVDADRIGEEVFK